ncbi:MAG: proline dehydrogenase/delta-pyrroline-5-carboxylate dehydrogenase [Actinomycetota bacterium]
MLTEPAPTVNASLGTTLDDEALVAEAIELARKLLATSLAAMTRRERRRQARLGRLLGDPAARQLVFGLTDEVLRFDDPLLASHRFAALVRQHPTRALGAIDRLLLRCGAVVAPLAPRLVMPLVTRRIKAETTGIVLSADDPGFARHVATRRGEGVRLNVNLLGEAILSDAEADERLRRVCERIDRPDVDYVSVKISAVVANLDAMAFDHSLDRVCDRLRVIYRRAAAASPRTFVNLDMEEYRDLELTLQAFMRVLDEAEFIGLDAGIVLQAYLPDSHEALERLGTWAQQRRALGGGTVKVRLVKGANLAMEIVEADLHGWVSAPYATKAEVDASYKAMLDSTLRPEWSDCLRVGLASHNLFDVAWGLIQARERDALHRLEVEMLEGMAPAQARAVLGESGGLLMYAPVVAEQDFDASIAYLSRRLDENTQPDNFLRALFDLVPTSEEFAVQAERFVASVHERATVARVRRRRPLAAPTSTGFANEPDGDATDVGYRSSVDAATTEPPVIAVQPISEVAAIDDVVAVALAAVGTAEFGETLAERRRWLASVAEVMAAERSATVGLMTHAVGKTVREGDPEVSEAIDFCRYYGSVGIDSLEATRAEGCGVGARGVVVVVGPWNFPYAIPVGGVAAALAAGNSVILKPAPEATSVGAWIARQFWDAGVPRESLQLVVCPDNEVGQRLVTHPDVDSVVLTGSYETAAMFLGWKPDMRLFAETSGKNALVVTASADIDQAIADLVRSAFGHAGQKCSAASLGIVEASVLDDPAFLQRLSDAVRSLRVLPATDTASMVGPLIALPAGNLLRALTQLEPGESWLVEPRPLDESGRLWSPGVRLGVQPGSWFHLTECFGPVLGLMRANDLDEAIRMQNATSYGLTGGLHTLDESEISRWLDTVEVGNAYVNRHITGAIVQRQPFGGWKRSSVGGGSKAGGPDYVLQFATIEPGSATGEVDGGSLEAEWAVRSGPGIDASGLSAESNVLRHRPLRRVIVRHDGTTPGGLAILRSVSRLTGAVLDESDAGIEDEATLVGRLEGADRVRVLCPVSDEVLAEAHRVGAAVVRDAPVASGRAELRHWTREQAISRTMHRHGRLLTTGQG